MISYCRESVCVGGLGGGMGGSDLQWMIMGPGSSNISCLAFTWARKLRTPPGSWGTPWSGQLRYW